MDIKEMYMERAEEIASFYGKEFYELTEDQQDKVWRLAEVSVAEGMCDQADLLRKRDKEGK